MEQQRPAIDLPPGSVVVQNATGRLCEISRGAGSSIVRVEWARGTECGLEEARQVTEGIATVAGHTPVPVLVDVRSMKSTSRQAREHFGATPTVTAIAFLVGSPLSRVIASFFMSLNRPAVPTRLFTDPAEAMAWLGPVRH
ncbi:MAG: hypothetical protein QOH08_2263 [Chloroflexota bacterium]|jgi:hypothetical protein|nr:hypothetical protein [Chloroflexota bacterium]